MASDPLRVVGDRNGDVMECEMEFLDEERRPLLRPAVSVEVISVVALVYIYQRTGDRYISCVSFVGR